MPVLTIKDTCPHCGKETIVYKEDDKGVLCFSGCQHCDKTLGDLPWKNKRWFVAKLLKPKEAE